MTLRVKLKVVDCRDPQAILQGKAGAYTPPPYFTYQKCPKLREGQEFYADLTETPPPGFPCAMAWAGVYAYREWLEGRVEHHQAGPGSMDRVPPEYPCCPDGLRTVCFELRLAEADAGR